MTPLEMLVLHYVTTHPNTRRSTVVESLSDGDWDRAKRIRCALDTLCALKILRSQEDGRSFRYVSNKAVP
jgi:hypothetical protein